MKLDKEGIDEKGRKGECVCGGMTEVKKSVRVEGRRREEMGEDRFDIARNEARK